MTDEIQGMKHVSKFLKVTSAMNVIKIVDPHNVDTIKTTFREKIFCVDKHFCGCMPAAVHQPDNESCLNYN